MENDFRLIRPGTFLDGEEYLLRERLENKLTLLPVAFVAYDPSPAFVIVRNGSGRLRCLRDDLFVYSNVMAENSDKSIVAS